MPQSQSRDRYDSLLPTQVYSCFNGVAVIDAALFAPPHSLRFRTAPSGGDEHSECFLFCSDVWKALSPLRPDGTPNALGRGARIQIVPRASVGYRVEEYDRARKDRNTTAFELEGEDQQEQRASEMIDWEQWPPKLVTTYPYGACPRLPPSSIGRAQALAQTTLTDVPDVLQHIGRSGCVRAVLRSLAPRSPALSLADFDTPLLDDDQARAPL